MKRAFAHIHKKCHPLDTFKHIIITVGIMTLLPFWASAQKSLSDSMAVDSSSLVQFSGLVLDGAGEEDLQPIPFVTVSLDKGKRGVYTDWKGFFSLVVEKGDEIVFSAVGYQTAYFTIPDTLTDSRYSLVQLMTTDTINLPETVVFPWPSREHFKLEFLAMNVDDPMANTAADRLTPEALIAMANKVTMDGNENSDYYLRQEARSYYSYGQIAPMNIFNPMAWRDFFKAWKNGDFKKKN